MVWSGIFDIQKVYQYHEQRGRIRRLMAFSGTQDGDLYKSVFYWSTNDAYTYTHTHTHTHTRTHTYTPRLTNFAQNP